MSEQPYSHCPNQNKNQQRVEFNSYCRIFDNARTKLAISHMALLNTVQGKPPLNSFIAAADELLDTCARFDDDPRQIQLCEWIETRMAEQEYYSQTKQYQEYCNDLRNLYERRSRELCLEFGANVHPFFRSRQKKWKPRGQKCRQC